MEQTYKSPRPMARSRAKTEKGLQISLLNKDSKTLQDSQREAMRKTLLLLIHIGVVERRVMEAEVEFIGCALQYRLVTPHEAMQMAFNSGVLHWVFPDEDPV